MVIRSMDWMLQSTHKSASTSHGNSNHSPHRTQRRSDESGVRPACLILSPSVYREATKKEQRPLLSQSDPCGRCVESRGFIVTASRFRPLLPTMDGHADTSGLESSGPFPYPWSVSVEPLHHPHPIWCSSQATAVIGVMPRCDH